MHEKYVYSILAIDRKPEVTLHPHPPSRYTHETNSTLAHRKVGHHVEDRGGGLNMACHSPHTPSVQTLRQKNHNESCYTEAVEK